MTQSADWIAVDWGTSCLRAWSMSSSSSSSSSAEVLALAESDQGMSKLAASDFESALLGLIEPWLPAAGRAVVVCCGMVGAKQGWVEVPYVATPCQAAGAMMGAAIVCDQFDVWICPGVMQASPADVMRGEETQIAGLLATRPDFEGVVCLPGTHSKWVRVSGGRICSFTTFLTGELYGLLAGQSVLRHSVAADGWDEAAFLQAVAIGIEDPGAVLAKLFSLRAEDLLEGLEKVTARSRLSGYLIGLELGAARSYWESGTPVAIIGADGLSAVYRAALSDQGAEAEIFATDEMTLAGLQVAYQGLAR